MRRMVVLNVLVLFSWLLAACGSAATQAPVSGKPVNIAITSSPAPAVMGDVELVLTITDDQGNPIEGATVDVSADHTDMSGMGMSGLATDQGGGRYSIQADFSMTGNWKITVYVRKEGLDYQEDIDFKIQ